MSKTNLPLPRFALLDAVLRWEGRLNNARLRELFGLSAVRSSEWIREFRDKHPLWMEWDTKQRAYYATSEVYRPARHSDLRRPEDALSLARYLTLAGTTLLTPDIARTHVIWTAFPDLSMPQPKIFSKLFEAVRMKRAVEIVYRSMREPTPHKRVIFPHSVVRAGRRWHTRAFCVTNNDFRDYAIGRIIEAKILDTSPNHSEDEDKGWTTKVNIRLIAHPDLTQEQEELIRFEYFSNTSSQVDACRGCLVNYFIQDVRAATDTKTQRPPDYQLAVGNLEEIKPWLFPG